MALKSYFRISASPTLYLHAHECPSFIITKTFELDCRLLSFKAVLLSFLSFLAAYSSKKEGSVPASFKYKTVSLEISGLVFLPFPDVNLVFGFLEAPVITCCGSWRSVMEVNVGWAAAVLTRGSLTSAFSAEACWHWSRVSLLHVPLWLLWWSEPSAFLESGAIGSFLQLLGSYLGSCRAVQVPA